MSTKSLFVCSSCGNEFLKWAGKCPGCGEWNTLVETPVRKESRSKNHESRLSRGEKTSPISLNSLSSPTSNNPQITSGISEFDRAVGGGLIPGQVVLLAGEPGIGKSTLLLQVADSIENAQLKMENDGGRKSGKSKSSIVNSQFSILYVCGEESPPQIKIRAERLGISGQNIQLLEETDVDELIGLIENAQLAMENTQKKDSTNSQFSIVNSQLLIVDSVQTLTTGDLPSSQGSVAQVKECTARLINLVKRLGIPTIIIGHVNKEGDIAGPKVLEHMVDTVLYLEGQRFGDLRLLRCVKNRFGDVGEVGVFKMTEKGFVAARDPSSLFLSESSEARPGSVISVILEGSRPILLEIQALTAKSAFNYPRRTATGFDLNRLYFLCAVAEKFLKLPLSNLDVYVNVTGGAEVSEPAADLAVVLALASSYKNLPLGKKTAVFGEVGLGGEIRPVLGAKKRLDECRRMGFNKVISGDLAKTLAEACRQAL